MTPNSVTFPEISRFRLGLLTHFDRNPESRLLRICQKCVSIQGTFRRFSEFFDRITGYLRQKTGKRVRKEGYCARGLSVGPLSFGNTPRVSPAFGRFRHFLGFPAKSSLKTAWILTERTESAPFWSGTDRGVRGHRPRQAGSPPYPPIPGTYPGTRVDPPGTPLALACTTVPPVPAAPGPPILIGSRKPRNRSEPTLLSGNY